VLSGKLCSFEEGSDALGFLSLDITIATPVRLSASLALLELEFARGVRNITSSTIASMNVTKFTYRRAISEGEDVIALRIPSAKTANGLKNLDFTHSSLQPYAALLTVAYRG
jgi:hypothetical protein